VDLVNGCVPKGSAGADEPLYDEAERLSDVLTVLAQGKVVAQRTPKAVLGDMLASTSSFLEADGTTMPAWPPGSARAPRERRWPCSATWHLPLSESRPTSRPRGSRASTKFRPAEPRRPFLKLASRAGLTAALGVAEPRGGRRHLRVYLKNWHTAFLPPVLEPITLLLAFGLGLGAYMSSGIE